MWKIGIARDYLYLGVKDKFDIFNSLHLIYFLTRESWDKDP